MNGRLCSISLLTEISSTSQEVKCLLRLKALYFNFLWLVSMLLFILLYQWFLKLTNFSTALAYPIQHPLQSVMRVSLMYGLQVSVNVSCDTFLAFI